MAYFKFCLIVLFEDLILIDATCLDLRGLRQPS